MRLVFKIGFLLALLVAISVVSDAQNLGRSSSTSTTAKPKSNTCSLGCGTNEDMICASNGVTYKNSCRYECAKSRNKRLRMVKKGTCGNSRTTSLRDYRRGQSQTSTTK